MAVHLLDVNVLIALVWANHIHHDAVHRWFGRNTADGWATCPITQCGFIRVSCNARALAGAVSPSEATQLLTELTSHFRHVFWPDDISWTQGHVAGRTLTGHQQVTDAYLLALASRRGQRIATMDRAIVTLAPDSSERVELIPT
jgi:uncharacterized protein